MKTIKSIMISYICFKLLVLSIDGGLAVFSLRPVEMLSWKFPFIAMQYIFSSESLFI